MVSTRRSTAKANRVLASIEQPNVTEASSDTIRVEGPPKKRVEITLGVPKASSIPLATVLSGTIRDHDISPTSPATDEISKTPNTETLHVENTSLSGSNRKVSPHARETVPNHPVSMSGSCHDPIIVNETSSPPRPIARPLKRKHADQRPPEPHKFIANGYRDLYNYGVSRPALGKRPADRSMLNRHQSHDIYQMMNARIATETYLNHNVFRANNAPAFPFHAQYPPPAQTLAHPPIRPSFPASYAQYYHYAAPPPQHPITATQTEDMLRKNAKECMREFSKMASHQQNVSNANPYETKSSKVDQRTAHCEPSRDDPAQRRSVNPFSSPQIRFHVRNEPTVPRHLQPNLNLHYLIRHTSLLTSLLQIYPYSADQKGLIDDIRAMASFQNHHMDTWLDSMSPTLRKQKESSSDTATGLNTGPRPTTTLPSTAVSDKDRELRRVFSAEADIWQNGTGHSVADVFGTRPSSAPTASPPTTPGSPNQLPSTAVQQSAETEAHAPGPHGVTSMKQARTTKTRATSSSHTIPVPSPRCGNTEKGYDSAPGH